MRAGAFVAALTLAFGASGCLCSRLHRLCPEVKTFTASPRNVCVGGTVTFGWAMLGHGYLESTPPNACNGPVGSNGTRTCTIDGDTRFLMDARRLGSGLDAVPKTPPPQAVTVYDGTPRELPFRIGDHVACARSAIVAIACRRPDDPSCRDLSPAEWDGRIRIDTIRSSGSRTLSVTHAGRSAVLDPGHPSTTAFRGTTVSGEWVIASPLTTAETCLAPEFSPPGTVAAPTILGIEADAACPH